MRGIKHELAGKKINDWNIIGLVYSNNKGERVWLCQCKCGKQQEVVGHLIVNGNSKRCLDCNLSHPYEEEFHDTVWHHICLGAKARGYPVAITKSYAYELFLRQNRKCLLSNLDIWFPKNSKETQSHRYTASLDRINSSQGYVLNNVMWIHKDINIIKGALNQNYFLKLCIQISEQMTEEKKCEVLKYNGNRRDYERGQSPFLI